MDKDQLAPVAAHLAAGYLDTVIYSRRFLDDYDSPPSLMAKAHHMLSVVQAGIGQDERYKPSGPYAEYGRVQFVECQTGDEFLLRSAAAVRIEGFKIDGQGDLLPDLKPINPCGIHLVVYDFSKAGVSISITGTIRQSGRRRLEAASTPVFVGIWPYLPDDTPPPFDQDAIDPFEEVGNLGDDEQEDEK